MTDAILLERIDALTTQNTKLAMTAIPRPDPSTVWCLSPKAKRKAAKTTRFFVHCLGRRALSQLRQGLRFTV